jgi:glycosyltransferase involved in cell wall biosynthesis
VKPSVVILTLNEQENLPSCLESLRPLSAPMFVVDSGSTDTTTEIAESFGGQVYRHPFVTHAAQWTWALQNLPLESDWVLALDADQRLTPELSREIAALPAADSLDGFYLNRRQIFRGRWIRHGTYYPKYLLKLFRCSKVMFDQNDRLDHHFYISGATAKLRNDLIEDNRNEADIAFWITKHTRYALLKAEEEYLAGTAGCEAPLTGRFFGSPDQRILWLRQRWRRMPLFLRPWLYFFYRYVLRSGWLDGKEGFIFHFLHAFWFRLLVDVKLDELRLRNRMPVAGALPGPQVETSRLS